MRGAQFGGNYIQEAMMQNQMAGGIGGPGATTPGSSLTNTPGLVQPGQTFSGSYVDPTGSRLMPPPKSGPDGQPIQAQSPQSFMDIMKGKLTDPTTLGLGAASLMLTDMNQEQEWDDSAGTFPEVNRALTDEERASYAMKGLTDPNRTFQPPNVDVGGIPQSMIGREGGSVGFAGPEGSFVGEESLAGVLDKEGIDIEDYLLQSEFPSDRPDTMSGRLELPKDEEIYDAIIAAEESKNAITEKDLPLLEESILDEKVISDMAPFFEDPDITDILGRQVKDIAQAEASPSRRTEDWDQLLRDLKSSKENVTDTELLVAKGGPIHFQTGGGTIQEEIEESIQEKISPPTPQILTPTVSPVSRIADTSPMTANQLPTQGLPQPSVGPQTAMQQPGGLSGLGGINPADIQPEVMENLVERLRPEDLEQIDEGGPAFGPITWKEINEQTDISPTMKRALKTLMPDLPQRLNKVKGGKKKLGFSGTTSPSGTGVGIGMPTSRGAFGRTGGGGPFKSSSGGPVGFQSGGVPGMPRSLFGDYLAPYSPYYSTPAIASQTESDEDIMENLVAGLQPKVVEEEEIEPTYNPNYDVFNDPDFMAKYYAPKKDFYGNPMVGQYEKAPDYSPMTPAPHSSGYMPKMVPSGNPMFGMQPATIPSAKQARAEFPGPKDYTPPPPPEEENVRAMGNLINYMNRPRAGEIEPAPTAATPPEKAPMTGLMGHIEKGYTPPTPRQMGWPTTWGTTPSPAAAPPRQWLQPTAADRTSAIEAATRFPPPRGIREGGSIPFQAGGFTTTQQTGAINPTVPIQMNPQAMQHLQQEAAKGVPWAVELMGKINQRGQQVQQSLNPQVQRGMAEGGPILESGSFVIPADVVSSFGDGSSDEGHRKLSQQFGGFALGGNVLGGEIKGPGGGLDDLVQSSIEGVKSARVSNDEFVIPSNVVNRIGGGNTKAGSEKLYNFIKNVRLNKHGTSKQPASINNVGIKSLLG
jgi:hypothetical protein